MGKDLDSKPDAKPKNPAHTGTAFARRIRNWASRRIPSFVDSEFTKQSRERFRKRDTEEIPASIPPITQSVDLKRVYAAEFYTPAHAERLLVAFEKLGWNSADTFPFRANASEWVARSRRSPEGTWLNLGVIVPPDSQKRFHRATVCKLPAGFDVAHAEFMSISPSLSCIVLSFDTEAEHEKIYEGIARSQVGTKLIRNKRGGHSVVSPRSYKRRAVGKARTSIRRDILDWFHKNLPGAFSTNRSLELFPTCELLFTDNVSAISNQERSLLNEYLGLEYGRIYWDSCNLKGLTLVHPASASEAQKTHAVIHVERGDLAAVDNSTFGGSSDEAYLNRLSIELPKFVGHWSIDALLRLYQAEISGVRDRAVFSSQSQDATNTTRQLQRVVSNSIDVSLLAAELPNALREGLWNEWDFVFRAEGEPPVSFVKTSTQRYVESVRLLGKSDQIIRNLIVQQGNLINALEAIASQRKISRLTIAMTILTIAIFALTAVMAYDGLFQQS